MNFHFGDVTYLEIKYWVICLIFHWIDGSFLWAHVLS